VVLVFALVPDLRVLPCSKTGISPGSGDEGSCLVHGRGGDGIFSVVNTGHTLHMPGYTAKLVRTATHGGVVGFKIAISNTGDRPLRFDRGSRHLILTAPRLDNQGMASVRERRTGESRAAIPAGRTRTLWVSYSVPPVALPQLRQPPAALVFMPGAGEPRGGLEHLGEIRLWRVSTPAGVKTLSGLRD
jgi:hypothetical protein